MSTFGINILAQFVQNRAALLDWVDQAQPDAVVVMDDPSFASAIRIVSPTTTVIHRSYDPHEHEWHTTVTPQEWLNRYLPHAQGGNVLQVLNEPQGYGDLTPLVAWCVEIMDRCPPHVRLCLPNFAVGHPREDFTPQLDPMLQAFARHPRHILGLHEYWQSDPIAEPYRTGRFKAILARCTQLGIPPPHIVITEAGRDVGGGINDGWRAVFDEATYAAKLEQQIGIYQNSSVIGMCVFCYGKGGGDSWQSFDIENALTVLRSMKEWNEDHRMIQLPKPDLMPLHEATVLAAASAGSNTRNSADTSGAVKRQLVAGDVIQISEKFFNNDGYNWYQLGVDEYIADTPPFDWEPKQAPALPPNSPPIDTGAVDRIQQLLEQSAGLMHDLADKFDAMGDEFRSLFL